jgi:GDP-L-fucose synthase
MEVQGAMGKLQLAKLANSNETRRNNFKVLTDTIFHHSKYDKQFTIMQPTDGCVPAWFGLPFLLNVKYSHQLKALLSYLESQGVENRPVVTGNIARQSCLQMFGYNFNPADYPGAEMIHTRGFFIGSHNEPVSKELALRLSDIIFAFPFAQRETVLVTGSTGLVGSAVKSLLERSDRWNNKELVFVTSAMGDLRHWPECSALFKKYRPTYVIHVAAKLAGSHEMATDHISYYLDNSCINRNVLKAACNYNVRKVVSCLSTAMFPCLSTYPITEKDVDAGPLHPISDGYGSAKRELLFLSRWYSKISDTCCVCIIPSNIYGINGVFTGNKAPFVHAFIRKCHEGKRNGVKSFDCFGTPDTYRQILFADDLARFLLWAAYEYDDSDEPLTVAGPEESLSSIMDSIKSVVNYDGAIAWQASSKGGPDRRTASIQKLSALYGDLNLTPMTKALKRTFQAYLAKQESTVEKGL